MEAALLYLYLCILEGKKLELTFSNFLTIKKLELDFTSPFNHGKNHVVSCVEVFCAPIFLQILVLVLASHTSPD